MKKILIITRDLVIILITLTIGLLAHGFLTLSKKSVLPTSSFFLLQNTDIKSVDLSKVMMNDTTNSGVIPLFALDCNNENTYKVKELYNFIQNKKNIKITRVDSVIVEYKVATHIFFRFSRPVKPYIRISPYTRNVYLTKR